MIPNTHLRNQFKPSALPYPEHISELYALGTSNTNKPIYWQINPDWSIANARYQDKVLYNQPQGIFGLHLLNLAGENTAVYFMRSEQECLNLDHLIPNNKGYRCLYMFIPNQDAVNQLVEHSNILKRCKIINFDDRLTFNIPLKVIQSVNKHLNLTTTFTDEPEQPQPDFSMLNYPTRCRTFQDFKQMFSDISTRYNSLAQQLNAEVESVVTIPILPC